MAISPSTIFYDEYVVFDFETTGLNSDKDEIIEIGAIKVRDNIIIDQFETLVKPKKSIPFKVSQINNISNAMVANSPILRDVLPAFIEFVGELPVIGHNIKFDLDFLDKNSIGILDNRLFNESACTLKLSRRFLRLPNYKLKTVAEYCNIEVTPTHRAITDCIVTHKVYECLKTPGREYEELRQFSNYLKSTKTEFKTSTKIFVVAAAAVLFFLLFLLISEL